MQQEKIVLNQSLTATTLGTSVQGFLSIDDSAFQSLPISYLLLDYNNTPINIVTSKFDTQYTIDNNNIYHYDPTIRFVTGKTVTQNYNFVLSTTQQQNAITSFNNITASSTAVTTSTTIYSYVSSGLTSTQITNPSPIVFVNFINNPVDDYYTNIAITRTIDQLDTLSVHNAVINNTLTMNSPTGVLFGKMTALQKIKDDSGNTISIPLANVIVGIFNVSSTFPTVSSLDNNGNRIALNLQENCNRNLYFNNESFTADTSVLLTDLSNSNISDQYKYTTTTNENGEFILFDIPVGQQTFMFEVDLLKQGLTKDEVALNFFPYSTDISPTLGEIPHLYFRQISVNVVPSWGTFQTGYTELNVSVPLDLRKWTTHIFPPVSITGQKLEAAVSSDASNSLKIQIRDMTVAFNSQNAVRVAQIMNDLDRNIGQQYYWINEFTTNRLQAEYTTFGCYVLKLPANLYDPNGFVTDANGTPTTKKGVWLSSYQFSEFTSDVFRKTGAIRTFNGSSIYFLSHFDLNYVSSNSTLTSPVTAIGQFPYEKPWTINYPAQYSIPAKPIVPRFNYGIGRAVKSGTGNNSVYWTDDPAWADGDLVGNMYGDIAGGFGIQSFEGAFFANRIAQVATSNFMYKYERNVAWNEEYANGFEPLWNSNPKKAFVGQSKVGGTNGVPGEQYQRLECGYGYFFKPQGWPRIVREPSGNSDIPFFGDMNNLKKLDPNNPGPGTTPIGTTYNLYSDVAHINDVYNLGNQNLAVCMDDRSSIKEGTLDIYRIVNSGIGNVSIPSKFIINTFVVLHFSGPSDRCVFWQITNTSDITVHFTNEFTDYQPAVGYNCRYTNPFGGSDIGSPFGGTITLIPGGSVTGPDYGFHEAVAYADITLPGNSAFDPNSHQYTVASYTVNVLYNGAVGQSSPATSTFDIAIGGITPSGVIPAPQLWAKTTYTPGGNNGGMSLGLTTNNTDSANSNANDPQGGGTFQGPNKSVFSLRIENNPGIYL